MFCLCVLFIFFLLIEHYNKCDVDNGINDTIIIQVGRTCYYNGYEIDCDNDLPYETIPTSGNFDCRPIMKTDREWINLG